MADAANFTKAFIESISPPPQGRVEYIDTKQAGLRLRVTANGVKTFCVLKRIRGAGMERITLARYPDMTIEQARKKAAEFIGKIAEGNNPAEARRSIKAELTFAELFVEYGKRHGQNKRSWNDDQQRYRDYLAPAIGNLKVSSVTTSVIARILSNMERRELSNSTINHVRALASVVFSLGKSWGLATNNPVSDIKTRKTVARDRFLQGYELPRFFASLLDEPNPIIRSYFLIALLTGARRSNVLAMRWSELNLEEGIWRIPRTKNGDPQNVTLSPDVVDFLTQYRTDADSQAVFVFPGGGRSGHLVEPKKGWNRIFDRDELTQLQAMITSAGGSFGPPIDPMTNEPMIESFTATLTRARECAKDLKLNIEGARMSDLRIHDLRRTFGSWQAKSGTSLSIIGKSLNHKNQATTAIYARLDLDPVRASVDKATGAMLDAAGLTDVMRFTKPVTP